MAALTIYFGYGSNLWLHQMEKRCPESTYLGIARLPGYRWHINDRGYANVAETNSADDEVWGLVYSLSPSDERRLDVNEGVPVAYEKEMLPVEFWQKPGPKGIERVDVSKPSIKRNMLVYIDRRRTTDDEPKREYIHRMNMGIQDALTVGVPKAYVDDVMRYFIPDEEDEEIKDFAMSQALEFQDESDVIPRKEA